VTTNNALHLHSGFRHETCIKQVSRRKLTSS
jgi:hypothetical protein